MSLGEIQQRFAGAEADLEHARRGATECLSRGEAAGVELDAVARPELVERAFLGNRRPPAANHEAAYGAPLGRGIGGIAGLIVCHFLEERVCKWSKSNLAAECSG